MHGISREFQTIKTGVQHRPRKNWPGFLFGVDWDLVVRDLELVVGQRVAGVPRPLQVFITASDLVRELFYFNDCGNEIYFLVLWGLTVSAGRVHETARELVVPSRARAKAVGAPGTPSARYSTSAWYGPYPAAFSARTCVVVEV